MAVESLELQEQQSDRKELEETLVKLEKRKEKLIQQIKATRQFCYEESQQVMPKLFLTSQCAHVLLICPLRTVLLYFVVLMKIVSV